MYDVDLDVRWVYHVTGHAGVLPSVLGPRLLDDQRADRRRRLVRKHANATSRRGVVDRLENIKQIISRLY